MVWHYQVMRHKGKGSQPDTYYIHEYYIGVEGEPNETVWTHDPVTPSGESVADIRWALEHMIKDLDKYEPVDYK